MEDTRWLYRAWFEGVMIHHDVVMEDFEGWEILMQSTGLTDKNGVLIFEGDACEHGVVIWNDGAFCLDTGSIGQAPTRITQDRVKRWEILGNVYENPELIPELRV